MPRWSGPSPRVHNAVSYLGALLVFAVAVLWRAVSLDGALLVPLGMWSFHFARRASESLFLHRYGKKAVSLSDAALEYVYYWGFAAWIGWAIARPGFSIDVSPLSWTGLFLFCTGESGNFSTHVMLSRLRPKGTTLRRVPRGLWFELVSCPNYLFEIVSWVGFALIARVPGAYVFLALSAAILAGWANTRHAAYRAEFPAYPPQRKRLVPFVF